MSLPNVHTLSTPSPSVGLSAATPASRSAWMASPFNSLRRGAPKLSHVLRLPIFTKGAIAAILLFWIAGFFESLWDLRAWGGLVPNEIGITTLYRINTFPFIHLNIFHVVMNILALTPLLERFEREHGTLTTLALFFGPLTTVPAFIYVFIEWYILRANTPVVGASIWVFLLLGVEAIRTYKVNPYLVISTYNIPTWTMPLFLTVCIAALVPNTSFLGHLCGLAVGYVWGLGFLKFTAPPEWALRWIEGKLSLQRRVPHYVSVDKKTAGRFGILPTSASRVEAGAAGPAIGLGLVGSNQRLGS